MIRLADFWSMNYSAGGGPITQLLSQRIGALTAWLAQYLKLSPSAVTLLGSALFLAACIAMAMLPNTTYSTVLCIGLLQLAYGLDCADGQLARATQRTSLYGAWLDIAMDFCRNLMLAAAVLLYAQSVGDIGLGLCVLASFSFAIGMTLKLYTLTAIRKLHHNTPKQLGHGVVRSIALAATDTATFLFLLGALRIWPRIQLAYMAIAGIAYTVLAFAQADRRLRA